MFSRILGVNASSWAQFIFSILCVLQAHVVRGEENGQDDDQEDDIFIEDDWVCLVVMSLIFAFCISMFGSIFAYVTYLDDAILKRYKKEAVKVQADVGATEFARGGTGDDTCFEAGQKEYCVFVEYDQIVSGDYRIRIKKQIQAMESDFIHPHHPELNAQEDSQAAKEVDPRSTVDPESLFKKPQIILNQDSFFQNFFTEERKVELLVLNDHPKSGFSSRLLKRRLTLRYQLSSMAFVVSTNMLTLFCFRMAVRNINEDENTIHRDISWAILVSAVVLIAMQIPCIHYFLGHIVQEALEQEYFETAEVLQTGQDDSSLSSGSDVFLSTHFRSVSSVLS